MRMLHHKVLFIGIIICIGCAMDNPMDESQLQPSLLATWDPRGVELFFDASAGTGTLRITDNCVYLILSNQRTTLLVWPEPTSWNAATQSIGFVDVRGEKLVLRDGDRITPGGHTLGQEDFPFVIPPNPACQADSVFVVNAVTKDTT